MIVAGKRLRLIAGLAALAGATACGTTHAKPAHTTNGAPTHAVPGWKVVAPPHIAGDDTLDSISASSMGNAWAVGSVTKTSSALAYHSQGNGWKRVTPPKSLTKFNDVSTSGKNNTWFAGAAGDSVSYAVRWKNGMWSTAKAPAGDANAVAAAGDDQAWLAGGVYGGGPSTAYLKHFDGSKWSSVTLPKRVTIKAVKARSTKDVWAVGKRDSADGTKPQEPFAVHWNGNAWKQTPTPTYTLSGHDDYSVFLDSLAYEGANDVFAAGSIYYPGGVDGDDEDYVPILMHWNGTKWSKDSVPYKGTTQRGPIAPDGKGGIWMGDGEHGDPSVFHRDKAGNWSRVALPAAKKSYHLWSFDFANVPGTTTTLGTGWLVPNGDPNDPTVDGVVLSTTP